ncbi:MAG: hypothetical protein ACI4EG_16065 [Fusicatenibacter sp.]
MSDADFSKVFFKENQQEMRDLMFGPLFCWFFSEYGDFSAGDKKGADAAGSGGFP